MTTLHLHSDPATIAQYGTFLPHATGGNGDDLEQGPHFDTANINGILTTNRTKENFLSQLNRI